MGQSFRELGTWVTIMIFFFFIRLFMGGIAKHLGAPSNGKIKFVKDLVHPIDVCSGYNVFYALSFYLYSIDLLCDSLILAPAGW